MKTIITLCSILLLSAGAVGGWQLYKENHLLNYQKEELKKYLESGSVFRSVVADKKNPQRMDSLRYNSKKALNKAWAQLSKIEQERELLSSGFYSFIDKGWTLEVFRNCSRNSVNVMLHDHSQSDKVVRENVNLQGSFNNSPFEVFNKNVVTSGLYVLGDEDVARIIAQLNKNGKAVFKESGEVSSVFDFKDFSKQYSKMCN